MGDGRFTSVYEQTELPSPHLLGMNRETTEKWGSASTEIVCLAPVKEHHTSYFEVPGLSEDACLLAVSS